MKKSAENNHKALFAKDQSSITERVTKPGALVVVAKTGRLSLESKASKKTQTIFEKIGITQRVMLTQVETRETDSAMAGVLRSFGAAVRKETAELEKAKKKQRKEGLKTVSSMMTGVNRGK